MKKKKTPTEQKDKIEAQEKSQKNLKTQSAEKYPTENSSPNRKTISCHQIQQKSTRIVNDNLISTINPKRTSMNLSSFIHVFRKKVRQTTIAKQFQNSLEKFDSHTQNRSMTMPRQKGGFIGSFKKKNQLLIENNRFDTKIKKVIISDLQYKDRKINPKINSGQELLEKLAAKKQFFIEEGKRQKSSKLSRRRILTYSNGQHQDSDSHTISFYKAKFNIEEYGQNPQNGNSDSKFDNFEGKYNSYIENSSKSMIFTNRRLENLNSYQRPNLMYNLSLYRKKNSYNVMRKSQKKVSTIHKTNLLQK